MTAAAETKRRVAALEAALRAGHPRSGAAGRPGAVHMAARTLNVKVATLSSWLSRLPTAEQPDWSLEQAAPPAAPVAPPDRASRAEAWDAAHWRAAAREKDREIARLERALDEIGGLAGLPFTPPEWVSAKPKRGRAEALGLIHLSDVHMGEVVRPEEVDGANAYDPAIAERRVMRLIDAACEIVPRWAADAKLGGIVVACNGDLVSGDIHEELRETNALTSHEQVGRMADLLTAAAARLAERFRRVSFHFTPGNHGRTTAKPRSKAIARQNYDMLIGGMLHNRAPAGVHVSCAKEALHDYEILGWTVLQTHGDRLGSKGGLGFIGPAAPMARGAKLLELQRATSGRPIDILLTGHWHTAASISARHLGNGSVVGHSEYVHALRARVEPPQQWLALIHSRWGLRERLSVQLEDPPGRGEGRAA